MVAALLCGAAGLSAQGQAPPAPPAAPPAGQQPAPAAQPPAGDDQMKFPTQESVLIMWQIKPAKTADFESAWAAIKTKASASEKPDMKELGESLKMYKATVAAGPSAIYVFELNPPSKTLSYDPSKILYASEMWPREEADALFKKIAESLDTLNVLPLAKIGGAAGM